jgi:two-component system, response regulator YesN
MYKVVIIDDEPMICRSLVEKVDWAEWNCVVCGTGSNGLEGKAVVTKEQPDIVITDVRMPGMDGLELADYIQQTYPNIVTLVISGYNEFDYARKAIQHHVFDYLLKPIDKDDLRLTMQKVLRFLDNKKETYIKKKHTEKYIEELSSLAENKLLMDCMLNNVQELMTLNSHMDIHSESKKGQVVVYDILNSWEQIDAQNSRSLYQFAMNNILYEVYQKYGILFQFLWIEDKCVVVTKFATLTPTKIAEKRVHEAMEEAAVEIEKFFKTRVFVGKGDFFNHTSELNKSYKTALNALKDQLFWSLKYSYTNEVKSKQPVIEIDDRIYIAINEGNESETLVHFDHLMNSLRRSQNLDQAYSICLKMLITLNNYSKEWNLDYEFPTLNQMKDYTFFKDFSDELRNIVQTICQLIHKQKLFLSSTIINKILLFLQEEYDQPDMSLQYVANKFQLSLSHLSRLFKKETDNNFNDYLSKIRINKAKKLLKEEYGLTIHQIANKVGYMDGRYFGQVFKKYCGMTPSEFKAKFDMDKSAILKID